MIHAKIKMSDIRKETFDTFRKKMEGVNGSYVTVGVHEDAGEYAEGGKSVAEIALYNEFGTENIPSRPFMRSTVYGAQNAIENWQHKLGHEVTTGKMSVKEALDTIGARLKEMIKNKINSNMRPSNAPSTAKAKLRKGVAPRTLIETTLLLRSIDYKSHTH